jgi:hypothetical protein
MKIAQIAPLYEAVPPKFYGDTERIVAHLSNALVELGHEVTLFASAEARTRATRSMIPMNGSSFGRDGGFFHRYPGGTANKFCKIGTIMRIDFAPF